jgi:imidazole glycerol-phosphate synthase subunit HisH
VILIVDNGGANLASVRFALERLGVPSEVSADADAVLRAERVLLPGVGAARPAMERLDAAGVADALRARTGPTMGICLGMQLLFEHSGEGHTPCLGILPGEVTQFDTPGLRVPQMGWNRVRWHQRHPLVEGIADGAWFYFVHSYRADLGDATLGECDYGGAFSAAVARDNFAGFQFHPERSGPVGGRLLSNFLEWAP